MVNLVDNHVEIDNLDRPTPAPRPGVVCGRARADSERVGAEGVTSPPQTLVWLSGGIAFAQFLVGPAGFWCVQPVHWARPISCVLEELRVGGRARGGSGRQKGGGRKLGGGLITVAACARARARAGGSNGDQPPPGSPWPGQSSTFQSPVNYLLIRC